MSAGQFGARLTKNGASDGASFRLWAPAARRVELVLDKPQANFQAMSRGGDGWFTADVAGLTAGAHYKFRIDGEIDVPDPASAFQPDDVFGPSELIDHDAYAWRASDWRGRPWQDTVLIETPRRHLHQRRQLSRDDRQARSSGGDRDHGTRTDAAGGPSRASAIGAMMACCGTRQTAPMAGPKTSRT